MRSARGCPVRIFRANHVRWDFARTVRCGTQQDVALRTCGVRLICPALRFFKIHPAVSIRMRVREKLHENIRLLLLLRRKCRCFLRSRNKQIYRCDRLIRVPDATKGILHSENGGYLFVLACLSLYRNFITVPPSLQVAKQKFIAGPSGSPPFRQISLPVRGEFAAK